MPKSFRVLADYGNVPRTTLQHRARGRMSIEEKGQSQSQQYLYPWEEKTLVKYLIQEDALGRSVRIKYIRSIAFSFSLARQRATKDRPSQPPGRNWPQFFYKHHPDLKASKIRALDWNRYSTYDNVTHWFKVIGKLLQDSTVLQEKVYNMDETGIMLSKLNSIKVLVGKDNKRG